MVNRQKYRKAWEEDDRFAGWLQEIVDEPTMAWCRVCHLRLQAHIKSLAGHSKSKKHMERIEYPHKKIILACSKRDEQISNELSANDLYMTDMFHSEVVESSDPKFVEIELNPLSDYVRKKKEQEFLQNERTIHALVDISKSFHREKMDECDYFCQSVAAQVRNLPLKDSLELQLEIQNLVTRKRLKILENSSVVP